VYTTIAAKERESAFGTPPVVGAEHLRERQPVLVKILVGSDLTVADYTALEARWIDRQLADYAALRRVDSLTGGEIIGRKGGNYAGIIIPYFQPGDNQVREYRLRRDQPDLEYDSACNLKPRQKYLSPPGRPNMLYFVPGCDPRLLRDISIPIVITEGEFKTLALWRLANHPSTTGPRFLPVGVSGVYNWRGTIGKTVGSVPKRFSMKLLMWISLHPPGGRTCFARRHLRTTVKVGSFRSWRTPLPPYGTRPNGVGYSRLSSSDSERFHSNRHRGASCPKENGRTTRTGSPQSGFRSRASWSERKWPGKQCRWQPAIDRSTW